ncbi:hypothetical protein [Microbulbifer sp. HZ11]|uniref:hypothetical protein n=1 Tax=Microbulbifer sp. HZ11 TaxID=1453501 RepID=UPI0012DE80C0|nr:hypothetical protein [Microbulbifer sp. HZ11]
MPRAISLFFSLILSLLISAQQAWSADGRSDYDLDDDGLIEINDWADLNEVRNNLDGTSLYGSSEGCPAEGCVGFELTTDLDFDTNGDGVLNVEDTFWNSGAGWQPIGSSRDEAFSGIFHGNGYLIRNLMIARPTSDSQGLFGIIIDATVKELGLSGPLMRVQGRNVVGGLVGYAQGGQITATFVSGYVHGTGGGVGGLVGSTTGTDIVASYVTGFVRGDGDNDIAGLLGYRLGANVIASMSTAYVQSRVVGGLVGYSWSGDHTKTSVSYWATDASGQNISYGGTPATLAELQCPTSADDTNCSAKVLYETWSSFTDEQGNGYWDFGTNTELPGLRMGGRVYRDADGDGSEADFDDFPTQFAASVDSDGDGSPDFWKSGCEDECRSTSGLVLDQFPSNPAAALDTDLDGMPDQWNSDCDSACQSSSGLTLDDDNDNDGVANEDDAFPANQAASVDLDGDGFPDAWLAGCDSDCQSESGLVLDPSLSDTDNDGVENDSDAFIANAAAAVDDDGDGFPDAWLENCDSECQSTSGLTLDASLNDTDNDGVVNDEDAFATNSAASVDADNDGLPDAWHEDCDSDCQSGSGLTLDESLNDTDNDGLVNSEDPYPSDPTRTEDEDAPEILQVPVAISVAATGESTLVTLNVNEAQAIDNFDDELDYQVELNGELLAINADQQVSLPSGALSLDWFAVDDAGNRSEPLSQAVNVYPQVRFTQDESITGEDRDALLAVELSGPSPVYPISILATWVESESTATTDDMVTEGESGVDPSELLVTIDSVEALENAAVRIPVVGDGLQETDEVLSIALVSAIAGSADGFVMPIDDSRSNHRMTITDNNVAPTVTVTGSQAGEDGTVFINDAGEITLTAVVEDVNGGDSHSYQWYTEELPVTPGDQASFSFDPLSMALGEYSARVVVTDDGNPMLSSEEEIFTFTLQEAAASDDGGTDDGGSDSGDQGDGDTDNGDTDNGGDDDSSDGISTGGQTPVNNGGSSGGGSSGGSVGLWLLLLLALGGLWRRRATY